VPYVNCRSLSREACRGARFDPWRAATKAVRQHRAAAARGSRTRSHRSRESAAEAAIPTTVRVAARGIAAPATMPLRMPFVKIYLRHGKAPAYLAAVSDSIHQALVSQANVPADDRFHVIHELPASALVAHPTYGGVDRSDDLIVVEITLNAGRTVDVKKNLYADMAARLGQAVDLRADDLLVSLIEVTKENWSFGGGRATYA
jgi:4-oxalocrotonate tautomerase